MEKLHRVFRGIYLFTQATVLPLAIYYLRTHPDTFNWPQFLLIGVYIVIPFWLVMFIGMGAYRFPMNLTAAAGVVISTYLQLALFFFCGGKEFFYSFYCSFFSSVSGVTLCLLGGVVFLAVKYGKKQELNKIWVGLLLLLGLTSFVGLFLYALSAPLISRLGETPSMLNKTVMVLAMAAQIISIISATFKGFKEEEDTELKQKKDAEWEKWTGPVAGALLLSLLGAIAVIIYL